MKDIIQFLWSGMLKQRADGFEHGRGGLQVGVLRGL